MTRRIATALPAAAFVLPAVALTASPADAAPRDYYSSCAKLQKKFPHGVAKGARAADRQVEQGYGRPSTTKRAKNVYKVNKARLDRDKDGTACER